jgi:hypothetical protein
MSDILEKGPSVALGYHCQLEPFKKYGVTPSNMPALVLYLLWPPLAMGTFTATIRLPRALRVDQLICLHHFLLASF